MTTEIGSLSDTGLLFHEMHELQDQEVESGMDMRKIYPQYIPELMAPLYDVVTKARDRAVSTEIDREHEIAKIARFLGFRAGSIFATTSAGESIHAVLDYFSHPGGEVIIPDGSYARFPDFVESLPEERVVRWLDINELRHLVTQKPDEVGNRIGLIEELRIPAFAAPDPLVYDLIRRNSGVFSAVVYDCVNFVFNEDFEVQRAGDENTLIPIHYNRFPQAVNRIRLASLSKALPAEKGMFPNVSIVAVSSSVNPKDIEQFRKGMSRKHAQTPPDSELYAMAELLHDESFPRFIRDLRSVALANFKYFLAALQRPVAYDGLNAFIKIDLQDFEIKPDDIELLLKSFGLQALYSQLYFRKSRIGTETWIRVPLVINDREERFSQLQTKIKAIQRVGELTQATYGIDNNAFDGASDGQPARSIGPRDHF